MKAFKNVSGIINPVNFWVFAAVMVSKNCSPDSERKRTAQFTGVKGNGFRWGCRMGKRTREEIIISESFVIFRINYY